MKTTILFTGGGTAGHIFPGLVVAQELQQETDADIYWIGSKKGMEKSFVEKAGIPFISIPAGKMRRYFSLQNFFDIFKILAGVIKGFAVCRKYQPQLVFSKGGYVSVPLVFAAGRRGVPVITHESDTDPGLATRLNARYAVRICVSFEKTREYFGPDLQDKIAVTGNPVRREIAAGSRGKGRKLLGVPDNKKVIFALGGSQGALQINELVREILPAFRDKYFIVHQMGRKQYTAADGPGYRAFGFIGEELPDFLAAADLLICRAGANTLAELSILGKPAVLVPLASGAGRGDQVKNARLFAEQGAAITLEGEDATAEKLETAIHSVLDSPARAKSLSDNMLSLARRDAAKAVVREIQTAIGV